MEISISGSVSVLAERASNDSAEVLTTYYICFDFEFHVGSYISSFLPVLGACNEAMKQRRGFGNAEVINLVSDSGQLLEVCCCCSAASRS